VLSRVHSRPGTTASQNDDLNLLESAETLELLTQIIGICFARVPQAILEPFSLTVTEILLREYPDAVLRNDYNELRHIISQFTAPSRTGENDLGVFVCHWPPLTPGERDTLKALRRAMGSVQAKTGPKKYFPATAIMRCTLLTLSPDANVSAKETVLHRKTQTMSSI